MTKFILTYITVSKSTDYDKVPYTYGVKQIGRLVTTCGPNKGGKMKTLIASIFINTCSKTNSETKVNKPPHIHLTTTEYTI